jgi:hypothetical protein
VAHGTPRDNFPVKKLHPAQKIFSKNNRTPRENFSSKKIAPRAKNSEQKKLHPARKIFSKKYFPKNIQFFLHPLNSPDKHWFPMGNLVKNFFLKVSNSRWPRKNWSQILN